MKTFAFLLVMIAAISIPVLGCGGGDGDGGGGCVQYCTNCAGDCLALPAITCAPGTVEACYQPGDDPSVRCNGCR